MPSKRSRPSGGGESMRAFFKVRRRSTRMFTKMPPASKPGKALQKPALDAGSSSPQPAVKPQIEPARVCFMCDEGVGDMVQCTSPHCTRAAHRSCAGFDVPRSSRFAPAAEQEASFLCDECIPETEEGSKYNTITCDVCGSGEDDPHILLCDGCDHGFHMHCVTPLLVAVPLGKWFCMTCRPKHLKQKADDARAFAKLKKQASSDQTTILQFFGVSSRSPARTFDPTVSPGSKRGRRGRRRCSYNPKANRQVFRAPVPSTDVSRRVDQLASVTAAMQAKGIKYTDQLCYSPSASSSMNIASREIGGLQKMTKVNMAVFRKFKEMTAEGLFAPMVVSNDPVQGFVVRADARILDRTLLCEYVGDVHLLKDKLHGECDSLMELLRTGDPTTTLLISPKRTANIARFLSGINNHTAKGRRAQNVRSARFEVDGQARVVLYAARDISKGEMLCYDYNAARSRYPTQHFV